MSEFIREPVKEQQGKIWQQEMSRLSFLRGAGILSAFAALGFYTAPARAASGIVQGFQEAANAQAAQAEKPHDLDDLFSTDEIWIGDFNATEAAKKKQVLQFGSKAWGYSANVRLQTCSTFEDFNTALPFPAKGQTEIARIALSKQTKAKIIVAHSGRLLQDKALRDLFAERLRAELAGNRTNGFLGEEQTLGRKQILEEADNPFYAVLGGSAEEFDLSEIRIMDPVVNAEMIQALFAKGDENTTIVLTCGMATFEAVQKCIDLLNEDRDHNAQEVQDLHYALTYRFSKGKEVEAAMNKCLELYPAQADWIAGRYWGTNANKERLKDKDLDEINYYDGKRYLFRFQRKIK